MVSDRGTGNFHSGKVFISLPKDTTYVVKQKRTFLLVLGADSSAPSPSWAVVIISYQHLLSARGRFVRSKIYWPFTGVAKKTVMRLLVEAGAVASQYQDEVFRNLKSRRIQVDEMWGFIACKHAAAVALGYFAYNFIKIHSSLRCSPAMAAGVTNRLWEVSDLVALLEASERVAERAA